MKIIFNLILVIFVFENIYCEKGVDKNNFNPTIDFHIGGAFQVRSLGFINNYKSYFNDDFKDVEPKIIFGVSYKIELENKLRFGLLLDYYKNKFIDEFSETIQTNNGLKQKKYSENLLAQYIPIILTGEYVPFNSQFRTFIGGGLGINFSNTTWKENVSPEINGDLRIGGNMYSKASADFAAKFNCGIEIGFDQKNDLKRLDKIIIEFFYYYFSTNGKYFQNFKSQMPTKKLNFDDNYTFIPSVFGINLGISINTKGL